MIVDSSYRWGITAIVAIALVTSLLPGAYRAGFPRKHPVNGIAGGVVLVAVGLVLAQVFGESLIDALFLRARFGAYVPDTGIHSYGWFFVFGYSLAMSSAAILIIGAVMLAAGKVPPWISQAKDK